MKSTSQLAWDLQECKLICKAVYVHPQPPPLIKHSCTHMHLFTHTCSALPGLSFYSCNHNRGRSQKDNYMESEPQQPLEPENRSKKNNKKNPLMLQCCNNTPLSDFLTFTAQIGPLIYNCKKRIVQKRKNHFAPKLQFLLHICCNSNTL